MSFNASIGGEIILYLCITKSKTGVSSKLLTVSYLSALKNDDRDQAITEMCRRLKFKNTEDPDVAIYSGERDLIPFPMVH